MEQTDCPTICSCALPSLVPPYGQIDRYKLIFLHPFQDSPENILCSHARTIVSFSSFNRATVIYIIYDTVVRNDWRPWIAIYDTTKSATRKRENFFPLPPSLLLFYVKPNSNVQDSVGYPRVSVRDDDVANLLRIPQMRKTSGYTYTRSI